MHKVSMHPCPICRKTMWIVGLTDKKAKLTSCGHSYKFKKTKSQKDIERRYVRTPWGLELK